MFSSRETLYRSRAHLNVDGYIDGRECFGDFGSDVFPTHAMKDVRNAEATSIFFGTILSSQIDDASINAKGRIILNNGVLKALFWWKECDEASSFTIQKTDLTLFPQSFMFSSPVSAFEVVSHKNRTDISFGNVSETNVGPHFTPTSLLVEMPHMKQIEVGDALTASHADIFIAGKVLKILDGTIAVERV